MLERVGKVASTRNISIVPQTAKTGSIRESIPHCKSAHGTSGRGTVTGTSKSDFTGKASKVSPIFLK